MAKKKHSKPTHGDSARARSLHKAWLRAQLKLAVRALKKKTAPDSEHRAALSRLRSLEAELNRLGK